MYLGLLVSLLLNSSYLSKATAEKIIKFSRVYSTDYLRNDVKEFSVKLIRVGNGLLRSFENIFG